MQGNDVVTSCLPRFCSRTSAKNAVSLQKNWTPQLEIARKPNWVLWSFDFPIRREALYGKLHCCHQRFRQNWRALATISPGCAHLNWKVQNRGWRPENCHRFHRTPSFEGWGAVTIPSLFFFRSFAVLPLAPLITFFFPNPCLFFLFGRGLGGCWGLVPSHGGEGRQSGGEGLSGVCTWKRLLQKAFLEWKIGFWKWLEVSLGWRWTA